jgi:FdhE protein
MAPFVMAALQVCWVDVASRFAAADVQPLDIPGICPICGSLPVASIIRTEQPYQGYRFLHCALCATEWHMVRVMCTQCQATKDIGYHSIDGVAGEGHGLPEAAAVRAESCDTCHSYRKILYREKDSNVDPVADDLASVTLDLLMAEAGYHRSSGNPLLWQNPEA